MRDFFLSHAIARDCSTLGELRQSAIGRSLGLLSGSGADIICKAKVFRSIDLIDPLRDDLAERIWAN